jgi:hypothetical protein
VAASAPDYAAPIVGWRLWQVVETDMGLRLRSPLYPAMWPVRRELVAVCSPRPEAAVSLYWERRFGHRPPDERCRCGIYAGRSPALATAYMSRLFKPRGQIVHRVIGTVLLWGTVVECEQGWRASFAYPGRVYVPVPQRPRVRRLGRLKRPALSPEEIALGLADYGVSVEVVECDTVRELAHRLDREQPELLAA